MSPTIRYRATNPAIEKAAREQNLHPVVARILAARSLPESLDLDAFLNTRLKDLTYPHSMQDLQRAASRVAHAILKGEVIGLETDHDCDGQTSHAILYEALTTYFGHPPHKVRSYIGHRLNEGYGLSEKVMQRILGDEPRPTLVLTADNGSGDEARISVLKAAGIDVVVTDHHEVPLSGVPKSAYACLNPTRADCAFPDPYIAGCMVAWLLMTVTRETLVREGHLPDKTPKLGPLLDFVAVGTVADCVSLSRSLNNRIVVQYGLQLIQQYRRPCWRVLARTCLKDSSWTAEDLAFQVGPLLNSDGRLDSAFGSVHFLLSKDDATAARWVEVLRAHNQNRKKIQKELLRKAEALAEQQVKASRYSLCLFLETGHPGVHGIAATRVKEASGRPTVFLAPQAHQPELITGSVRGIEGFHVKEALDYTAAQLGSQMVAYGGHRGAGGLRIHREALAAFEMHFEAATRLQLASRTAIEDLGPILWVDTDWPEDWPIDGDILKALSTLEPFGREFEPPLFTSLASIQRWKRLGDGSHFELQVTLFNQMESLRAIWFNATSDPLSALPSVLQSSEPVQLVFQIRPDYYARRSPVQLQVIHAHCLTK